MRWTYHKPNTDNYRRQDTGITLYLGTSQQNDERLE